MMAYQENSKSKDIDLLGTCPAALNVVSCLNEMFDIGQN